MSAARPSPRPSPRKRREGARRSNPSPLLRGEGGARVSGRVRGGRALRFGTLMFLSLTLALAGCGKKGPPTAPPDEPNTYPRPYPSE
jgi:predicted small lipoprotein YifL